MEQKVIGRDNFVAGADAQASKRQVQSRSAGVDRENVLNSNKSSQGSFKLLYLRPRRHPTGS